MLARVLASLLCLVGAAAIALGVASATVWRGSDTLAASAQAADGSTLVVIEQGVLATGADEVRVEAAAGPGDTVVLAMGRTLDVEAWVGSDAHTVVTGLEDWTTLSVRDVPSTADEATADAVPDDAATDDAATDDPATDGTATDEAATDDAATDDAATDDTATDDEPAPASSAAPDPTGSDLWIEETTGSRTVAMDWDRRDGRWSLLVASTGENPAAPTLTLTWPREVTTPWFWPGVAGGAFLLLVGAAWWALLIVTARRSAAAAETRSRQGRRSAGSGPGSLVAPVAPSGPTVPAGPTVPPEHPRPSEHPRPAEPATEVIGPAQVQPAGMTGSPVEAPLTRRQLRELERLRTARGATAPSPEETRSTGPDDPSAADPSPERTSSSGGVPAEPSGRVWSPAWRATVAGAPDRSATEDSGTDSQVTWHPEAPPAGDPDVGASRTALPKTDGDPDTGRSQRWGERIAEHVPHLSRRARRAQQESADSGAAAPPPEPGPAMPAVGPASPPASADADSRTRPEPSAPPGSTTDQTPASTATQAPGDAADQTAGQRSHEARSASADAWRRAWGFPAAAEASAPDGAADAGTGTGSPAPDAEDAGTDRDGGDR